MDFFEHIRSSHCMLCEGNSKVSLQEREGNCFGRELGKEESGLSNTWILTSAATATAGINKQFETERCAASSSIILGASFAYDASWLVLLRFRQGTAPWLEVGQGDGKGRAGAQDQGSQKGRRYGACFRVSDVGEHPQVQEHCVDCHEADEIVSVHPQIAHQGPRNVEAVVP